jgi:hypothetical protein
MDPQSDGSTLTHDSAEEVESDRSLSVFKMLYTFVAVSMTRID